MRSIVRGAVAVFSTATRDAPWTLALILGLAACGADTLDTAVPRADQGGSDAGPPTGNGPTGNGPSSPSDGGTSSSSSDGGATDALATATDGAAQPPASVCGAGDWPITTVSPDWGPAWAKPDPSKILEGWPLESRYELWWIPMPKGVLSYRIKVPVDFDADPNLPGNLGYVRTVESPSTPALPYAWALSETACDLTHGVVAQQPDPPYALTGWQAQGTRNIEPEHFFRVRPKNLDHCVLGPSSAPGLCLIPGHTYYWNLHLAYGCIIHEPDGGTIDVASRCQPIIAVMRPRQVVDPNY